MTDIAPDSQVFDCLPVERGAHGCRGLRVAHAAAWLFALACNGCSLLFVKTAPSEPELRTEFAAGECTQSYAAPILDTVDAVGSGAALIYFASESGSGRSAAIAPEVQATMAGFWGAVAVASAIYGYVEVGDCNQLNRQLEGEALRRGDPKVIERVRLREAEETEERRRRRPAGGR